MPTAHTPTSTHIEADWADANAAGSTSARVQVVVEHDLEDGAGRREGDRAGQGAVHRQDAGGDAGLRLRHRRHRRRRHRRIDAPERDPEQQVAREQQPVAARGVDLREHDQAGGAERHADGHERPDAEPRDQASAQRRERDHRRRHRQDQDAGLERAVAEAGLQILRLQEHQRPVAADQAEPGRAGSGRAHSKQFELDDRPPDVVLDEPERHQEREAGREDADGGDRGPPPTLPWTSAITTAARPRPTVITPGMSIRPAAVSSRCSAVDARTRTTPSRQNGAGHPEEPAPADRVDQRAADERPDAQRQRRHTGPDSQRAGALAGRKGGSRRSPATDPRGPRRRCPEARVRRSAPSRCPTFPPRPSAPRTSPCRSRTPAAGRLCRPSGPRSPRKSTPSPADRRS